MLHSMCQQIWKTQLWPQDWKRSICIPISKKGSTNECSDYWTVALISHDSKVMLKILQVSLQHYMNWELPDVRAGFRKDKRTRDQIANICFSTTSASNSAHPKLYRSPEWANSLMWFVNFSSLAASFVLLFILFSINVFRWSMLSPVLYVPCGSLQF